MNINFVNLMKEFYSNFMYHSNDIITQLSVLVSGSSTSAGEALKLSYITQILDKGNPPSFVHVLT